MTATLTVLRPIDITTAMRTSTTATESVAAYVSTNTYAEGAQCRSDMTHRIYESKRANNTGHDPTLPANLAGATPWWQDIGPTNDWAMFDNDISTATVAPSPLTVVLKPGFFTDAQFFGLDADFIAITVRDKPGGAVIKTVTHELESSAPADYDEYFWDDFEPQTSFALGGVDQYNNAEISVTLSRAAGGTVACAAMVVGDEIHLGRTLSKAKASPRTYTLRTTDGFGNTRFVRRGGTTDLSIEAHFDVSEANRILRTIQSLQDVPCAFMGSENIAYSGLRCFGIGSGDITYDVEPGKCLLSLTVEGIISWQS